MYDLSVARASHSMQLTLPRASIPRHPGKSCRASYSPALKVPEHPFCHILSVNAVTEANPNSRIKNKTAPHDVRMTCVC